MTEQLEKFTEREEIEMLLPWYVTGRIDAADRARVDRYLEAHPEMRAQLDLVGDEMGETISANEVLPGARAGALHALRGAIADEPRRLSAAAVKRGLLAELARLFQAPTPRAVKWAGLAAAVLIMAQAAVIGGMLSGPGGVPQGAGYQTASGPKASGTIVTVQFAPGATADALARFLRAQHAEIVSGPKPGGFYEVRISNRNLSDAERKAALEKFKASKELVAQVITQ